MLGLRIAAQRKKLGISQTELARRLCVSPSAVGMYEQGRRQPSIDILAAMSRALNVSIDYLVTGRDWTARNRPGDYFLLTNCQAVQVPRDSGLRPVTDAELRSIVLELVRRD